MSADTVGWIEWSGGECPVDPKTAVDVKFRDGFLSHKAAEFWIWSHDPNEPDEADIIAYRPSPRQRSRP